MGKKFHKLNSECYLISGIKGFLVINLYTGDIIPLDNEAGMILLNAELNQEIDVETPILSELVKMGWSDFYDKPVYIEKIRVTNLYGKKHLWKAAPSINVATIQLTNQCTLNCADCYSGQNCPSCRRYHGFTELKEEEWFKIIDILNLYDTQSLILTGGDPVLYSRFEAVLEYAKHKIPSVYVHVPSAQSAYKVLGKANILYTVLDERDIEYIHALLKKASGCIKVFCPSKYKQNLKGEPISYVDTKSVIIGKENVYNTAIEPYRLALKMMYNECFYGKICINCQGELIPCLGNNKDVLGNVLADDFYETLKKVIVDYWYLSVDESDNKCRKCEYRYVCRNICYYSEKENKACRYDVEGRKWK